MLPTGYPLGTLTPWTPWQAIVRDDAGSRPRPRGRCRALLDYGLKFAEITDVNRRLDKLEGLL